MKSLRTAVGVLFIPFSWLLRPPVIQHLLRRMGFSLPYFLAKQLNYRGVVDFVTGDKTLCMQSYNTPIEMTIFWKGLFNGREGAELRIWHELAQTVSVVYDVGANTGVYSLVASTNEKAQIYAFEPVPLIFAMLKENISLNSLTNITPLPNVVSDENGAITLYIPQSGWVDVASVDKTFAQRYVQNDELVEMECQSVTMDSHASKEGVSDQTILVKIDVEGAELKVLQGMQQLMTAGKVICLVELLNAEAFELCSTYIPDSYKLYGVVEQAPYLKEVSAFVPRIKNYFLVPIHIASDSTLFNKIK
jgi:FkbM family methyltransferase